MSQRIVFMGTPDFAVPSLQALAELVPSDQLLAVTQPDRASGRGRRLHPPPVKNHAAQLGLVTLQVDTLRDAEIKARLSQFGPGLIVVAAFGLLLPKWVLELPSCGCINLHASLLPRFRGASPIPAAIDCGDRSTGVSLMQMERGLDTGPVYALKEQCIRHNDTTESLTVRLAHDAAELLLDNLKEFQAGSIQASPQRGPVVETRKIQKAHGAIDWNQNSEVIERHVRAMWPWPRAWTAARDDTRVQIHAATAFHKSSSEIPGTVVHDDRRILVATADGWLQLDRVQLPGKNAQPSQQLLLSEALAAGTSLGYGEGYEAPDPWIVPRGEMEFAD